MVLPDSPFAEAAIQCIEFMRPGCIAKNVQNIPEYRLQGVNIVMTHGFKMWSFAYILTGGEMFVPQTLRDSMAQMAVIYSPPLDHFVCFPIAGFLAEAGEPVGGGWKITPEWIRTHVRGSSGMAPVSQHLSSRHNADTEPLRARKGKKK